MIARRPSIAVIGTITDNGTTVVIAGWQLGLCAARCTCHRHPVDGHLGVLDQPGRPVLGLVSYRPGCDCCDPWTAATGWPSTITPRSPHAAPRGHRCCRPGDPCGEGARVLRAPTRGVPAGHTRGLMPAPPPS